MTLQFPLATAMPLFGSEGGFGLNLDLFETNIINLVIVIGVLFWFLKGFLGGILERRRTAILADLKDAEQRLSKASADLASVQKQLSEAQSKAERIRSDAKDRASSIRLESEKRTVEEMARLRQESAGELDAEASRASDQLRRQAAQLAIEKALAILPSKLDDGTQARLIQQSIQSLGNV